MLIGNAIFSLILSEFLGIIENWHKSDEEIGNGDELSLFLSVL